MPSSSPSLSTELEDQLIEHGTKLLEPPPAVDELLKLLEVIEELLIMVDQAPSRSMQDALLPCMMGLITSDILRHPDMDVKVSVAFSMSEITRITAPDPPYNDEQMKEVFQLMLATIDNLPHATDRCYKKEVSILDTLSRVKSCLMMLDLNLDDLVIQMFKQFLEIIGSSHSSTVFTAMETIMIYIIDESDDIELGLLTPLLESVKKENQDVSPLSWKLGEKVITSCAAKLKPYLMEALKSVGSAVDDYAQIVANICENRIDAPKQNSVRSSLEHLESKASEAKGIVENRNKPKEGIESGNVPKSVSKKRGRKPNTLMKPEEGYDHSLIVAEKRDDKIPHKRKSSDMESLGLVLGLPALTSKITKMSSQEFPSENTEKEGTSATPSQPDSSGSLRKRGRSKRTGSIMCQDDPNSLSSSERYYLNANVKEEVPDAFDVGLEKELKDTSHSKEKPKRHIKKIRHSSRTGKEAIVQGIVELENGADGSSGSKGKLFQKLSMKAAENIGTISSCENHTKTYHNQRLKATITPKSNSRRKCSGGSKEKTYEMGDLDGRLVGKKINVWWPMDKTFYEGVVESFDAKKKRHKILYTDGEVEILNLYKKRWELIPDNILPDGEKTDIHTASPSPVRASTLPKRRRKSKLANEDKVASSSRRRGYSEVKEVEAKNFEKSLVKSRIDHSNIDGSEVGTYRGSEKLKNDGAEFEVIKNFEDDGVKSGGCEKPGGEYCGGVMSGGDEKLKDDDANSGKCEMHEDDVVNSKKQFNEVELINFRDDAKEMKSSNSGEEN